MQEPKWTRCASDPLVDLFQVAPPEARTHHRPAEYISSIAVSFTVVLILAPIVAKRGPTFKAASLLIDHLMSGKLRSVACLQALPIIMDGSRETNRRVHASCVGGDAALQACR